MKKLPFGFLRTIDLARPGQCFIFFYQFFFNININIATYSYTVLCDIRSGDRRERVTSGKSGRRGAHVFLVEQRTNDSGCRPKGIKKANTHTQKHTIVCDRTGGNVTHNNTKQ